MKIIKKKLWKKPQLKILKITETKNAIGAEWDGSGSHDAS